MEISRCDIRVTIKILVFVIKYLLWFIDKKTDGEYMYLKLVVTPKILAVLLCHLFRVRVNQRAKLQKPSDSKWSVLDQEDSI